MNLGRRFDCAGTTSTQSLHRPSRVAAPPLICPTTHVWGAIAANPDDDGAELATVRAELERVRTETAGAQQAVVASWESKHGDLVAQHTELQAALEEAMEGLAQAASAADDLTAAREQLAQLRADQAMVQAELVQSRERHAEVSAALARQESTLRHEEPSQAALDQARL